MKKQNENALAIWIFHFLEEEILIERNYSKNTQKSYRDTFVLYLDYLERTLKTQPDKFDIQDVNEKNVRGFLRHLIEERQSSTSTINQRLALFKSFSKYLMVKRPEWGANGMAICSIHPKKSYTPNMDYLTKEELDVLLELPDKTTKNGYRDYVILTLMYNTGARVSEISNTRVSDLDSASADGTICIHGKGNKTRTCPLTKKTTLLLRSFIDYDREFLFYGTRNNPISRFGIYNIVKKYIEQAKKECLSLKKKKITPHSFRHTAATHMILAKEDLNTVRMMLGHSSLQTTMRYTKLNGEQLRHAIEHCAYLPKTNAIWKSDLSIKERLKSL